MNIILFVQTIKRNIGFLFAYIFLLSACQPASIPSIATLPLPPLTSTSTLTPTPIPLDQSLLWVSPAVPSLLRDLLLQNGFQISASANHSIDVVQPADNSENMSAWIYALVAPFPTVIDDVTQQDLLSTWSGSSSAPMAGHGLLMAESTLAAFTTLWGEPASGVVRIVSPDKLIDTAWNESAWAIIPFEDIHPKWKVLSVEGQSPLSKNFDANVYPLKINFGLSSLSFELPRSNRDASKLATVVLTGVTGLVRATAATMEMKGITYPGSLIGDWLRGADVAHVSNEIAFDPTCPTPSGSYTTFMLCSDPKYLELFLSVGIDVVELTGDHVADRGTNALLNTLALYKKNNLLYYGGGANADEARQPLLMNVNGNKLAFMGCNAKVKYPKATATVPGAANCDYDYFVDQIKDLKMRGYMVIFTFQHEECYSAGPCYTHEEGFRKIADAGAVIVSGSQAHFPHVMEFRGDSFIHYGLGNLFFDQMTYILPDGTITDGTRREFLDRHVFYDGRYLGTELLTAMLEDYSRPRPMTEAERIAFLSEYFHLSGWIDLLPTSVPQPTVTLTPIALP
jgi:hypothetical protein